MRALPVLVVGITTLQVVSSVIVTLETQCLFKKMDPDICEQAFILKPKECAARYARENPDLAKRFGTNDLEMFCHRMRQWYKTAYDPKAPRVGPLTPHQQAYLDHLRGCKGVKCYQNLLATCEVYGCDADHLQREIDAGRYWPNEVRPQHPNSARLPAASQARQPSVAQKQLPQQQQQPISPHRRPSSPFGSPQSQVPQLPQSSGPSFMAPGQQAKDFRSSEEDTSSDTQASSSSSVSETSDTSESSSSSTSFSSSSFSSDSESDSSQSQFRKRRALLQNGKPQGRQRSGGAGSSGPQNPKQPDLRTHRKEYRVMTDEERKRFHAAVNKLKTDKINGTCKYDLLVLYHGPTESPAAHWGAAFLPWHREFLTQ
jgi:hypothetical protein